MSSAVRWYRSLRSVRKLTQSTSKLFRAGSVEYSQGVSWRVSYCHTMSYQLPAFAIPEISWVPSPLKDRRQAKIQTMFTKILGKVRSVPNVQLLCPKRCSFHVIKRAGKPLVSHISNGSWREPNGSPFCGVGRPRSVRSVTPGNQKQSALVQCLYLWSFNIAMGNGPFIEVYLGLPIQNGDFSWRTVSHNQMVDLLSKRFDP